MIHLNTVEYLDITNDKMVSREEWEFAAPLNSARTGLSLIHFPGKSTLAIGGWPVNTTDHIEFNKNFAAGSKWSKTARPCLGWLKVKLVLLLFKYWQLSFFLSDARSFSVLIEVEKILEPFHNFNGCESYCHNDTLTASAVLGKHNKDMLPFSRIPSSDEEIHDTRSFEEKLLFGNYLLCHPNND